VDRLSPREQDELALLERNDPLALVAALTEWAEQKVGTARATLLSAPRVVRYAQLARLPEAAVEHGSLLVLAYRGVQDSQWARHVSGPLLRGVASEYPEAHLTPESWGWLDGKAHCLAVGLPRFTGLGHEGAFRYLRAELAMLSLEGYAPEPIRNDFAWLAIWHRRHAKLQPRAC
jgi:hypothetical protein